MDIEPARQSGVTLEIGQKKVRVKATVTEGEERARLWEQHSTALPWFQEYPEQVKRPIPMVRLTPVPAPGK